MNANKQDAGGLPELPEPFAFVQINDGGDGVYVKHSQGAFSASQMRAYGEQCRAASVEVEALERNLVDAMKEIHRLDQARQRWIDRAVRMRRAYREQRDLALSRGVPEGNNNG